jgi:hypothetical protein
MDDFRPFMPVVTALRNPGMRDRHWSDLTSTLGFELRPDDRFTLRHATESLRLHETKLLEKVQKVALPTAHTLPPTAHAPSIARTAHTAPWPLLADGVWLACVACGCAGVRARDEGVRDREGPQRHACWVGRAGVRGRPSP